MRSALLQRAIVDVEMTRKLAWVAALACAAVMGACGSDNGAATSGGSGAAGPGGELPCDVSDMLALRCQQCHAAEPKFGAPMPLVSRADLQATALDGGTMVATLAVARMQDDARMPPPPNAPASSAETALLQQWIDAGMPAREPGVSCDGGGGGMGGGSVGCEPDMVLTAAEPFTMPETSIDEQVCFGISVSGLDQKRHITAIAPMIDNDTIIHHMLLLQAPSAVSPTPAPCAFTSAQWKLLYAWGPGTPPQLLPPEAGYPIEAGQTAHFVLQVHYNNLQGLVGETDQSGIALCTTEELRSYDADVMAFGATGFNGIIPNATSQLACDTAIIAQVDPWFPITVFQSWPHMHQIGRSQLSVVDKGGSQEVLADVPDYDFNYQIAYPTDVTIDVGDSVSTTCTWQNDSATSVGFGENTQDEMCFNFVSYYPRVEAAFWHWLLPAEAASCNMTQP
jgi:hypothetical protein